MKVVFAPLLNIRHWGILLKCPLNSQDVVSVFESYWKHFSNVSDVIDRSLLQGATPLEHTVNQIDEIFIFALRHSLYQLRFGWLRTYDHLGSCRSHLYRTVSRPRTEPSLCPLFRTRLRTFVSSLCSSRLVVVRLFSYTTKEADHSSISDEHYILLSR